MFKVIKKIALCSLFVSAIAGGSFASAEQSAPESEWIELFNGKNLDGWEGDSKVALEHHDKGVTVWFKDIRVKELK